MLPQLDRIIESNKWLKSDDMSIEEKYINAYAIARGVNAINTPPEEPKELTEDELMELYDKNPTFQELIEKKRLEAIKQSQQVPTFSASSGAVNAALNIPEKPKTLEEASKRTMQMFGLE
jgi:division protein CdvB (Snf7/Vps24/ESCRT-III family)